MKSVNDRELLDDAKKKRLELDPVAGEELEALGKEIIAQPPEVVERMKKLLEHKKSSSPPNQYQRESL